jgi:hypothetical protein
MNSKPIPDPEEAERRQWTLPEEELPPCITARRQPGEHRWFRSPNVVCLVAHFDVVELDNGVSLDFANADGPIRPQHYAFEATE